MITKTMKIEDTLIFIPELEKYQGKIVEIKVKEKKRRKKI